MARSTADIQAEIALTRDLIERRLDALGRRAPRPLVVALALVAAGALTGVLLSRLPLIPVLSASARTVRWPITSCPSFSIGP
jgi:hypothetical protein